MAKKETTLERTYNVPLRKEFQKVPRWRKTKKASTALREFIQKHMKSEDVKIGPFLNKHLWKHGIKNPPHHVKITVQKNEKGVVKAELFGHKIEEEKSTKKKSKLQEVAEKAGVKMPKKTEKKAEKKEVNEEKVETKEEVKENKEEPVEEPKTEESPAPETTEAPEEKK